MSVDRRLLNWGVFLVILGLVPLAVTQGWVPRDTVARAWELWPLILIGAGIGLILSRTPLRALGGIVVAGTFGLMLGALVAVGFTGFTIGSIGCGGAAAGAAQVLGETGSFEGGSGRVTLEANCTSLEVSPGAGAAWSVDVRGTENARPTVERSADGVVVRSPSTPIAFPFATHRSTWRVQLGIAPQLDVELSLNAGSANLDLAGANLSRLSLDGNAIGDSRIDLSTAAIGRLDVGINAADLAILLPGTGHLQGAVEGNAASVKLCAPAGVRLRLITDKNITASNNFEDRGLVQRGDAWESADYGGATAQVELRTTGSAISYTLNPEDGCK